MPDKTSNQKSSTLGKCIIVILCCAILLFLLLPFLDGSLSVSRAKNNTQKATPQIFTGNPLQEMAQKLLAALGKKSKRNAFGSVLQGPLEATEQTALATPPARNAVSHQSGQAQLDLAASGQNSQAVAAFVNEEGEWVLINQTEPDSNHNYWWHG